VVQAHAGPPIQTPWSDPQRAGIYQEDEPASTPRLSYGKLTPMPLARMPSSDWQAKARPSWILVCVGAVILILLAVATMALIVLVSPAGHLLTR
jgi:hypothetical protein